MEDSSSGNNERFSRDDRGTGPMSGTRPISGIVHDIVDHISEIIRSEVRLARAEISRDVRKIAKAGLFLAVGVLLALYALGFILLAAVYALATTLPSWAAALVVAVGIGIIGGIFVGVGRKRMKLATLKPDKTIESLQENVTWMKNQTK